MEGHFFLGVIPAKAVLGEQALRMVFRNDIKKNPCEGS
jgi:hypothetical protein